MIHFEKIITAEKPVLVDFYADWCEPCKWLEPILEELQDLLADSANVVKIHVDESPDIAEKYTILSVPTLVLFKAGQPVWRMNGFKHAKELHSVLIPYL